MEGSKSKHIDEVEKNLKILHMPKEEQDNYKSYLERLAVDKNIWEGAIEKGLKQGREEGMEKGIQKGKKESLQETAIKMNKKIFQWK